MNNETKALNFYMNLPYEIEIMADKCGGEPCFLAVHPELYGCMAQGRTPREALQELKVARSDYLAALLARGRNIPMPESISASVQPSDGSDTTETISGTNISSSGMRPTAFSFNWTEIANDEDSAIAAQHMGVSFRIGERLNNPQFNPAVITATEIMGLPVTSSK